MISKRNGDDLFRLLVGRKLGSGEFRNVYQLNSNSTYVLKEEFNVRQGFFCNVQEWTMWRDSKDTPYRQFLAPCLDISPNGTFLVMEKTEPIEELPGWLPDLFTDLKVENFGKLPDGRIVCHDYAFNNLGRPLNKIIMRKVKK